MTITTQKSIVKRIFNSYLVSHDLMKDSLHPMEFAEKMLVYRYCLEMCGLELNEIITLTKAENYTEAIEQLFAENSRI